MDPRRLSSLRSFQVIAAHLYDPCQEITHLIASCEITLNTRPYNLQRLDRMQKRCLCHILFVSSNSTTAPFKSTELSIFPIRHLLLALCYLSYLVCLPQHHLTHHALETSFSLRNRNHPSCVLARPCPDLSQPLVPLPITPGQPRRQPCRIY